MAIRNTQKKKIMQLWTIQPDHLWQQWQKEGTYRGHLDYVDTHWLPAYQWLITQMENRLGPRPHPHAFPVWAWYQYNNPKRRKPDLRCNSHLPRGQQGVRLEIEVEDHLVLLSDFFKWSAILNNAYLGENDEDEERFYAEMEASELSYNNYRSHPDHRQQIISSWPRVFDLDWTDEKLAVQATFWELHIKHVKSVTSFLAR